MELDPYIDALRTQLGVEAEAGAAVVRLALLEVLSDAADEITREVAPGSVELRLRGGSPEFVVNLPAEHEAPAAQAPPAADDDSAMVRINLRLSEQLKASIEVAAGAERMSVNAWLVRAASAALAGGTGGGGPRPERRGGKLGQSYKGWVQ